MILPQNVFFSVCFICVLGVIAAFDAGIQVSYSKEDETVTLAFPEELKVSLEFC